MSNVIKYVLVFLLCILTVLQSIELVSAFYRNSNWREELTLLIFILLIVLIITNIYFKSKRSPEKPVFRDNKFISALAKVVLVCVLFIAIVFSYIQYLEADTQKMLAEAQRKFADQKAQLLIECQSR